MVPSFMAQRSRATTFTWRRAVPLLLVAPLLIYMVVFYALPVISMLLRSVNEPTWSLANYAALPDDPVFLKTFSITLNTAFIVTLATLVLGYPVALVLVRPGRMASVALLR